MSGRGVGTGPLLRVLSAVGIAVTLLPLVALLLRAPWAQMPTLLADAGVVSALRLSVVTSAGAVAIAVVLGVPVAWLLARTEFAGRGVLRSLVVLPMVLPPVVAGMALLAAFGRAGLLGGALGALGVSLPFTAVGTTLAQAFVSAPFLIVAVEAGFAGLDRGLEDAAATLGAPRRMIWRDLIVPAIRPSLLAGVALCWARALGEFGATITFAGSLGGRTETLPLAAYRELQTDPQGAVAVGVVLLVVSITLLIALRARLVITR